MSVHVRVLFPPAFTVVDLLNGFGSQLFNANNIEMYVDEIHIVDGPVLSLASNPFVPVCMQCTAYDI